MREYREYKDIKDFLPIGTDMSHIGQGYRLPILSLKVDLLDLMFLTFNIAAFLVCIGYIIYRKLTAFRPNKIAVELSNSL